MVGHGDCARMLPKLDRIAAEQHGLLTCRDVLQVGVPPATLTSWIRRGRLRPLHRGVYAPEGVAVTPELTARAATLATGHADAAASHQTAARVHGIGVLIVDGAAHVTVPTGVHRPSRPELFVHRSDLAADEVTVRGTLRVTSVPRTLHDLLRGADRLGAVWACEAALRRDLLAERELDALVSRSAGRSYGARMRRRRALVDVRSESPLETAIRLVLHDAGLPPPVSQHPLRTEDGHLLARLDLAWPDARMGLEADGKEPHGKPRPVYTDRWRTNALVGWQLVRFTWYDVLRRPAYVVATVRAHLAAAA